MTMDPKDPKAQTLLDAVKKLENSSLYGNMIIPFPRSQGKTTLSGTWFRSIFDEIWAKEKLVNHGISSLSRKQQNLFKLKKLEGTSVSTPPVNLPIPRTETAMYTVTTMLPKGVSHSLTEQEAEQLSRLVQDDIRANLEQNILRQIYNWAPPKEYSWGQVINTQFS